MSARTTAIKLKDSVIWTERQNGQLLVLDVDIDSDFYELEGVAAEMFLKLAKGQSVERVVKEILKEYDVEPETLEQDVLELISGLAENGLLKGPEAL